MIYLSWAALYEGESDSNYFEVMIPRLMEDLVAQHGNTQTVIPTTPVLRLRRTQLREAAADACKSREAFQLVFIHADTGGREIAATLHSRTATFCEQMHLLCQWPQQRCVSISPRHETEAWVLADSTAFLDALGYRGTPQSVGLPLDARSAERLSNPKATIETAVLQIRGRRKVFGTNAIYAAVAQRQSLRALRGTTSFLEFEASLRSALVDIGCVRRPAR